MVIPEHDGFRTLLALHEISKEMLEAARKYDWELLEALQKKEGLLKSALEDASKAGTFPSQAEVEDMLKAISLCHQQTLDIIEPRREHIRQYLSALPD